MCYLHLGSGAKLCVRRDEGGDQATEIKEFAQVNRQVEIMKRLTDKPGEAIISPYHSVLIVYAMVSVLWFHAAPSAQ